MIVVVNIDGIATDMAVVAWSAGIAAADIAVAIGSMQIRVRFQKHMVHQVVLGYFAQKPHQMMQQRVQLLQSNDTNNPLWNDCFECGT